MKKDYDMKEDMKGSKKGGFTLNRAMDKKKPMPMPKMSKKKGSDKKS